MPPPAQLHAAGERPPQPCSTPQPAWSCSPPPHACPAPRPHQTQPMEYSDAQGSASAGTGPWPTVEHSRFAISRSRRISNKNLPLVVCHSCKCHILKVWTARTKKNYGRQFHTCPTRMVRIICCKKFVKSILCKLNWLVCFVLATERRCWLSILGVGGGI